MDTIWKRMDWLNEHGSSIADGWNAVIIVIARRPVFTVSSLALQQIRVSRCALAWRRGTMARESESRQICSSAWSRIRGLWVLTCSDHCTHNLPLHAGGTVILNAAQRAHSESRGHRRLSLKASCSCSHTIVLNGATCDFWFPSLKIQICSMIPAIVSAMHYHRFT